MVRHQLLFKLRISLLHNQLLLIFRSLRPLYRRLPIPRLSLARAFFLFAHLLRTLGNPNRIENPPIYLSAIRTLSSCVSYFLHPPLMLTWGRKSDISWSEVHPCPMIDANRILDWAGSWLIESIVVQKLVCSSISFLDLSFLVWYGSIHHFPSISTHIATLFRPCSGSEKLFRDSLLLRKSPSHS